MILAQRSCGVVAARVAAVWVDLTPAGRTGDEIMTEKYVIQCPKCGPVEGYASLDSDYDESECGPGDADLEIVEEVFDSAGHPVHKVQCPQCGTWLAADRAVPA